MEIWKRSAQGFERTCRPPQFLKVEFLDNARRIFKFNAKAATH
jgi:hypothetical protein